MSDLLNKMEIINKALQDYIQSELNKGEKDIKDILTEIIKQYNDTKVAVTQCNQEINDMKCEIVYKKYK